MKLKKKHPAALLLLLVASILAMALAQTDSAELQVLQNFLKGVKNPALLDSWTGSDPCGSNWKHIKCQGSSISALQVAGLALGGTVAPDLNKLKNLENLQLQGNGFTGSLPSLSGLSQLQTALLSGNSFDTIPGDFFTGLSALTEIYLDDNPLNKSSGGWMLPAEIQNSSLLSTLSITNTSLGGSIPDFLGQMESLKVLNVAYNRISGGIPSSFGSSNLAEFRANNQQNPVLSGPITVVGTMQSLRVLWLHVNRFSGSIPEGLGEALSLQELKLNDNQLTGTIPPSLANLPALKNFTVKNNLLVGEIPVFKDTVGFEYARNNFCKSSPGEACARDVTALLHFLAGVGYPDSLTSSWIGNDPCGTSGSNGSSGSAWLGISCGSTPGTTSNVTVINLASSQLNGTLSAALGNLTTLTTLRLSDNKLEGLIPESLAKLPSLQSVDLSNNLFSAPVPAFPSSVKLNIAGNPLTPAASPGTSPPGGTSGGPAATPDGQATATTRSKRVNAGPIVGVVVGLVALLLVLFGICLLVYKKKGRKFLRLQGSNTVVVHPRTDNSSDDPEVVKIVVNNNMITSDNSDTQSRANSGPSDHVQVVEAGNLVISIHVLREATKNFSEATILGRGGFGVVYKGVLDDGTAIAVKRMESNCVVSNKGLGEFQAEIAVLTKVRHRHLVALLGYCIEGNEKMLVYEFMPQGTLSQHLFEAAKCGYPPLDWKQRLSVALDVARGMEYLHGLAHRSFIHRDLKPSNILLGDDLRAKVSDFGLVKLAPEGKYSVETRLAGTFGYLAPEYAVTGRVTTKADVFSFGVVLMELITGRRALDETQAEENMHLVTWFRRSTANKEGVRKLIDPAIESDDNFASISVVAELAGHCTAREPYQRPDMGHAVNVLSPLVEHWKPVDYEDESGGIDLDVPLPQAVKRWQELDSGGGGGGAAAVWSDTQSSLPPRPSGFAETFTSEDAR
ncbi:hypothetical protein SELMODRAFT_129007 [Selaginella moellendorffii]|uniref:non-specific serine/threonine protein kinase n=1 Tax=Selaginella moellendorffii TaxID=88036 RepID=D8T084_SELML|nr:receptor protein kinase TMK1 [Selaginella moellendorffii]XP_024518530.1 receptor protein kinase TMK1 [Selaginella moellendorffii]XP_024518531.1 receptor protein kinase TMK1 [Selaginella moellendorffii]EFJ10037.1 hypothetical protein SELMODRAFT_129007 [Selaginella moellendorffii]|eukprot:XP_002989009.2 receptor protein kinase TMK1 [Selaginella moellendorffii]